MKEEKKKRWEDVITSTNMTHNSRKAWKIIKHLSNDPTSPIAQCLVSENQVAHQLLINSRGTMSNKPNRPVLSPTAEESMVYPFSEEEYIRGIATLKNNKAAGIDDVLVVQLTNLGPHTHKWLLAMLNNCFTQNKILTIWRKSKIIAILKPGKCSATPKNYRPIYLLCHTYKLYKRLILNRIVHTIEEHLIKEQASFRPGKSCTSQLWNMTQHIEDDYQVGKITGTAFVDLSAAYDTVNHRLLIQKLYSTTPHKTVNIVGLSRICCPTKDSMWNKTKNAADGESKRMACHVQGSVLAPTLFNIYTNDQAIHYGTRSFIYADDLCITAQYQTFKQVENTIEEALDNLTAYYQVNSLRANPEKHKSLRSISGIKRSKYR